MRLSRLDQNFLPRTTKDVDLFERIPGKLHGIFLSLHTICGKQQIQQSF